MDVRCLLKWREKKGWVLHRVVGAVLTRRCSHLWRVPRNAPEIVSWGCGLNTINATCSSSRMTLSVTAPSLVTEPLT